MGTNKIQCRGICTSLVQRRLKPSRLPLRHDAYLVGTPPSHQLDASPQNPTRCTQDQLRLGPDLTAPGQVHDLETCHLVRCSRIQSSSREWPDSVGRGPGIRCHISCPENRGWSRYVASKPPHDDPPLCSVYTRLFQGSCWAQKKLPWGAPSLSLLRPTSIQMNTWHLS